MKSMVVIFISLCLIFTLGIGFADDEVIQVENPEEEFFEDDQAKDFIPEISEGIVYVGIGGVVEIYLEENPTTGFMWHVSVDDPEMVEVVVDEYITSYPVDERNGEENNPSGDNRIGELSSQLVGAGGVHHYVMRLNEQGMVKVTFEYFRDWEPENTAETLELMINVVPDGESIVVINSNQIASGGLPEPMILSIDESTEEVVEAEETPSVELDMTLDQEQEELNIFQKLIRWLKNLFR